jgi:hypothetical protein
MEDGVDAAVPVDAKNAPTATCKTAKNAVSHKRPHRYLFFGRRKKNEERTTKQQLQVFQFRTTGTSSFSLSKKKEPELGNPINGAMNQRSVTLSNGLTGGGTRVGSSWHFAVSPGRAAGLAAFV